MPTPEEIAAQAAVTEPEKKVDSPETEITPAPDPVEVTARAKGWKPKEEYTGDPGLYVDAKEFLGREPLFDRMRVILRENKEIKKTVDAMAKHWNKNLEREVNARIIELKYQKREAVKTGDVAQVEAIDKAIEQENERKADAVAPEKAGPDPAVVAWVEANPWYIKDPELHDFAVSFNDAYLRRHPGALEDSLTKTAEAVKKAYPDRFPKPVKTNGEDDPPPRPPVAPVEGGGPRPGGGGKKYTVSRLSADQKRVYDQIVTEHKVTTHDAFFKSLDEIGELK